jgi:hypothetical protein
MIFRPSGVLVITRQKHGPGPRTFLSAARIGTVGVGGDPAEQGVGATKIRLTAAKATAKKSYRFSWVSRGPEY